MSKKVALITGGSQGIGAATARLLASKGYFVAINYSSNTAKAQEIVKELGEQNAMSIQADAGQVSDIERMVQKTAQRYGRIDALVAAAAVFSLQEMADTAEGRFDSMMALNVKGPFFLAQVSVKHGSISHTADISFTDSGSFHAVWIPHRLSVNYSMSCINCDSALSSLQHDQGGSRADDSSPRQGLWPERDFRECSRSWTHGD